MRPPICAICDKRMEMNNDGDLIYFAKSTSDIEWARKMEETGMVGHPPYAEWFCGKHYDKAKEFKALTRIDAMKKIREVFSV